MTAQAYSLKKLDMADALKAEGNKAKAAGIVRGKS